MGSKRAKNKAIAKQTAIPEKLNKWRRGLNEARKIDREAIKRSNKKAERLRRIRFLKEMGMKDEEVVKFLENHKCPLCNKKLSGIWNQSTRHHLKKHYEIVKSAREKLKEK